MTSKDTIKKKVVKVRPSWELVHEDTDGNMLFEFTDEPKNYKPEHVRKATSAKILKEMESRMKL